MLEARSTLQAFADVIKILEPLGPSEAQKVIKALGILIDDHGASEWQQWAARELQRREPANDSPRRGRVTSARTARAKTEWLSVAEAMKRKGVSVRSGIFRALRRGQIRGRLRAGQREIDAASLAAWAYRPRPEARGK